MTERLSQLLTGEAGELDVPAPAPGAVLRQGRGLRRRNRIVVGACSAAAAVVVAGSVVALAAGGGESAAPDPAGSPVGENPVFSYGNEVFYDGPGHSATIEDKAVKSLFYTSAGVVVRAGDNSWSDSGGEQRFSLITPDGDVRRLGLVTEETVHASDPEQPYVVYGEAVDGRLDVVVYDVVADAEAARVDVSPTKDGWFPLSIDGDTVYVQNGYGNGVFAVDWRAGTAEPSDLNSVWDVAGGHAAVTIDEEPAVVDTATGEVLLSTDQPGYFDLSPDGRYAQLVAEESSKSKVFDVLTGSSVTLEGEPFSWGWTADGDLFEVEKNEVRTCDAGTGECTTSAYVAPDVPSTAPVTENVTTLVCQSTDQSACDKEWADNCRKHPDQCTWESGPVVDDSGVPELRLGGRPYES